MIKGKKFVDSPVETVDDGQGEPFQLVFTTKSQWDSYKRSVRRSRLLSVTSLIVSLLAIALAFISVQAPNLPH